MASRAVAEKWLADLTNLPTASGHEDRVVEWVQGWADRRPDLTTTLDSGGNLYVTQKGRKSKKPVLAVAHMDHPAFVIEDEEGGFEFRGGVDEPYFREARVEVVSRPNGPTGTVVEYDPQSYHGKIRFTGDVAAGDIAMWRFGSTAQKRGLFRAPACDDLAGAAAALAALDKARGDADLRHFGVLLTRCEEVGLIGAIHAAKHQTIPSGARLLSIETSRELPNARIGDGPIIRIGDRSTIFDRDLSNLISRAAAADGLKHQRRLMDGGGCEATAFGVYGYQATGLCLALGNWHNRGNLSEVEDGDTSAAIPKLEEISIDDYHGLIDLLLLAARSVDSEDPLVRRLDALYETNSKYLS